jgi:hypothetical protein
MVGVRNQLQCDGGTCGQMLCGASLACWPSYVQSEPASTYSGCSAVLACDSGKCLYAGVRTGLTVLCMLVPSLLSQSEGYIQTPGQLGLYVLYIWQAGSTQQLLMLWAP